MVSSRRVIVRRKSPITPEQIELYPGLKKREEKAARLAARFFRVGSMIRLNPPGTVPETSFEAKLLDSYREKIREARKENASSEAIESLIAKAKVLRVSTVLRRELGGRSPSIYQMLATIILSRGLHVRVIRNFLNELIFIQRHNKSVDWTGTPHRIHAMLGVETPNRGPLLTAVESLLLHTKNEEMSSREIARILEIEWIPVNMTHLNIALQLLETTGLVRKMPPSAAGRGGGLSVWAHRAYENPKSKKNLSVYLLDTLATGPKLFSQLRKPIKPGQSGNPNYPYDWSPTQKAIMRLEKTGMVSIETVHVYGVRSNPRGKPSGRITMKEARLTPKGKELMDEYHRRGFLPERLRQVILGEGSAKDQKR